MTVIHQLVLLIHFLHLALMNEITPINSNGNPYPIKVNEDELKKRVDPLSYAVLRKAATETAFTGEYTDSEVIGVYKCKACSAELFRSETKFHSGCGWPSFYAPTENDAVELIEIVHFSLELEPRLGAQAVAHTLAMSLRVKDMRFQLIKDGVLIR